MFCPVKITAPSSLIPTNLLSLLGARSLGYCALPVVARQARLTMTDGEIFLIEYPFPAFMPDWADFWQELQQNSAIAKLEGIGETVSDSPLRNYLFS